MSKSQSGFELMHVCAHVLSVWICYLYPNCLGHYESNYPSKKYLTSVYCVPLLCSILFRWKFCSIWNLGFFAKLTRKSRRESAVHWKLSDFLTWGISSARVNTTKRDLSFLQRAYFCPMQPVPVSVNGSTQVLESEARDTFFFHPNLVFLFI